MFFFYSVTDVHVRFFQKGGGCCAGFLFLNLCVFLFERGRLKKLKLWKKFENEIDKPVE